MPHGIFKYRISISLNYGKRIANLYQWLSLRPRLSLPVLMKTRSTLINVVQNLGVFYNYLYSESQFWCSVPITNNKISNDTRMMCYYKKTQNMTPHHRDWYYLVSQIICIHEQTVESRLWVQTPPMNLKKKLKQPIPQLLPET